MSGQKLSFKEKQEKIDNYIKENNVYEPKTFQGFDMRAYSAYIREKKLSFKDITPEIMNMFALS